MPRGPPQGHGRAVHSSVAIRLRRTRSRYGIESAGHGKRCDPLASRLNRLASGTRARGAKTGLFFKLPHGSRFCSFIGQILRSRPAVLVFIAPEWAARMNEQNHGCIGRRNIRIPALRFTDGSLPGRPNSSGYGEIDQCRSRAITAIHSPRPGNGRPRQGLARLKSRRHDFLRYVNLMLRAWAIGSLRASQVIRRGQDVFDCWGRRADVQR